MRDNYREAVALIEKADTLEVTNPQVMVILATAQVHATLALVEATLYAADGGR